MIGAWQLPTTPQAIIDLIIALLVWALTESVGNAIMDHVLGRVFRGYVGKVPYGSTYKHFLEQRLTSVPMARTHTHSLIHSRGRW
jgi:hypothetical protein